MEKESKVKFVTVFAQKPDAKDYTSSVEFENGDKGFFHHPNQVQDYFVLGSLVKYELEEHEKKDKSGKYYVIFIPGQKPAFKPKGGYNDRSNRPKEPIEVKREARSMLLRYVVDMAIAGTIKTEEIPTKFKNLTKILDESIDGLEPSTTPTV